jgi:hypothetical protein
MNTGTPDDETLAQNLAAGLRTGPQAAADALKAIVTAARDRGAHGDFASILSLADRADDAVERVKAQTALPDERLDSLATLAQQAFAVLALVGSSGGERDSGYFRASLAHAERLDAMTEGALRLVELVERVGDQATHVQGRDVPLSHSQDTP